MEELSRAKAGIVHIGLGAFMRAHLAVYTEQAISQEGGNWGICAANIRSNSAIVENLEDQNNIYSVIEYRSESDYCSRKISSIVEVIYAANKESKKLLERLQDSAIKIVSLSITEKGYYLNQATQCLLSDDEKIQFDIKNPDRPRTAIGILVAALSYRRANNIAPFTVLSCDNMPNNGESLKAAVLQFAAIKDTDLADWIEHNVSFPSSMVDRIVPALTPETLLEINHVLALEDGQHLEDKAAVACEHFSQWVIEDNFPQGRPSWEVAGAEFVKDVAPYEAMKLRLLNGSHSLLAYLGSLGELEYVSDCMKQESYVALIRYYMLKEAIPTLTMPDSVDLDAYVESLLARFENDSLLHKTAQIAMDGSQKIPQRWLTGIDILLANNTLPKVSALGLAAWMVYVGGVDERGKTIAVNDPMAVELKGLSQQYGGAEERVKALLQTQVFSNMQLVNHEEFVQMVTDFYKQLTEIGARKTVESLLKGLYKDRA